MFADFNKYNNEIDAVNLNEDKDVLVLQRSLYKITLTAYGGCCSCSIFEKFKENDFNHLIGKIIKKIKEIKFPADYDYEEDRDDFYEVATPHLYEITFKNSDETFQFMLVNYSNGYYDGYMTTDIVL